MDIKTLLHNLREEVSCSVCSSVFTDPKQLPCLHSFCLHCIANWHRVSHGGDMIRCPNCQALSRVPESGSLKDLPTSFYLNGMIDVLAIKQCTSNHVKCGNCDKKSSESFYCFQCCMFWCEDCVSGHNIIRSNKDHRVLALKEFQDKDYEDVLKRPALCTNQLHKNEELKYFCKNCEKAVCQTCVTLEHAGHALQHIEAEAERQKTEMRKMIELERQNWQEKKNIVSHLEDECSKLKQKGEDVKRNVQSFAESLISVIESKKKRVFESVDSQTETLIENIKSQMEKIATEINAMESSLEKADKILTRSTNAEIVLATKTFRNIFKTSGVAETETGPNKCDPEGLPVLAFVENRGMLEIINNEDIGSFQILHQTIASQSVVEGEGLYNAIVGREAQFLLTTRNAKGEQCYNKRDHIGVQIADQRGQESVTKVQKKDSDDGNYKISYFTRNDGKCKLSINVNGENVRGSPFPLQVKSMQFTPLSSFGRKGSAVKMMNSPCGVAVNESNEIAVTELSNHRVQIFSSNGNYLRSFGQQGSNEGQFNKPTGITFDKNGNIFVADSGNHRIQIFSGKGEYVGSFGGQENLCNPHGLSTDTDGNVIVADTGNKVIKIFSPNGVFLMKIGEEGSFTSPTHCIQYGSSMIVSDGHEHCIKVFDRKANFLFKFGKRGERDGEFKDPRCLLMNRSGHLMVCDTWNHRIQVFELKGKFVCKFGTKGENLGEFNLPSSIGTLSNGQIVVSERYNDRIQIFD